ncbi:metal ABC transporter substrate-binding protein [Actinoplanes sp. SE50]|uniref:MetQ/NlpA family ABC transporter substrate-binding protein n=1 Tax=unclassified Actinoplanes TaxID=2626549 RepID=UPI00023ED62D|nr:MULTISPECIES: MetQ/NlpA family ABC transporter substrate-binding protein [unclassified Actinoplanes]AEV85643.1 D-methionine-binding lipoprotein metQ [Actinoplanes sp. SE50/110]ATO84036.1 metal ABC transporter substrate-binding protein [Actinoplanes sp. SE50]SLM01446.1 metal ABC transporter substrate-binding protein [Actinoplanes sp. SE50/110]
MSDQSAQPVLPTRKRSRWPWIAAAAVVVVAAGVVVGIVATKDDSADATTGGTKAQTVRIGVADASAPYWKTYTDLAKQKLNVTVELVNFNDYSQPNPALKQKQLELNQFQHIQYLANYNVTAKDDLQPIGATAVYPLPLYSLKFTKPADFPADAKVAIPNDAINQARGLLVLQAAGLVTLKNGGSAFSSTADVESKKVDVVTLDASQTAGALQSGSVVGAIVNNNYATSAKLPRTNAIFQDDPASDSAAPYVNIFTARAADKDNPTYLKLAELYHDPSVEKGVQEANGGVAVLRTVPAADLQALLKKVQDQAVAAGK